MARLAVHPFRLSHGIVRIFVHRRGKRDGVSLDHVRIESHQITHDYSHGPTIGDYVMDGEH